MAQLWSDKQLNIKSYWFYMLDFSLCIVVLVAHITILILLYRQKHLSRRKNELHILISLCHTEITFAAETVFYVITGFITIDHILFVEFIVRFTRFSGFYLSILYYFFVITDTRSIFIILSKSQVSGSLHTNTDFEMYLCNCNNFSAVDFGFDDIM